MDAVLLINDGQHRRRGIEHAIAEDRTLAEQTVAVTIFFDAGLRKAQQMFADINTNQVKPSSALNMVYDHRNDFGRWVLEVLDAMPGIKRRVEMETSSVGAKRGKLWSVVAIRKTILSLCQLTEKSFADLDQEQRDHHKVHVVEFFNSLAAYVPCWRAMVDHEIPAAEVKAEMLIGQTVFLEALAVAGATISNTGSGWDKCEAWKAMSVYKSDARWEGLCIVSGRMVKTVAAVKSTAVELLRIASVLIPPEMREFGRVS
ncbi:DNA sulfur modification protein DndB [Marinobacterium stanieri]|uniref:DNA sulfur modification protein DndB n=1 Tax=Marinobacterium stanieri TaxID=49186 RepID=A0A1N6XL81_9GAMM|nr:DNA sulfur modification protein DndB [Marinobacterium stanieri]SIR03073.1 DNA sulfur modification protein DndB [Marinobacterium stanieri]